MADRVVAALADGLWQGALLALGVSLLLRVFRFNATTRYVVWSGTLLAVMALPMIAGRYTAPVEIPDLSAPSSFAEPVHVAAVAQVPPSSATPPSRRCPPRASSSSCRRDGHLTF